MSLLQKVCENRIKTQVYSNTKHAEIKYTLWKIYVLFLADSSILPLPFIKLSIYKLLVQTQQVETLSPTLNCNHILTFSPNYFFFRKWTFLPSQDNPLGSEQISHSNNALLPEIGFTIGPQDSTLWPAIYCGTLIQDSNL